MTHVPGRPLDIEVWSDVLCPWCYIGDERLEKAIAASGREDDIRVRVRAFQLDPTAPSEPRSTVAYLAEKYGTSVDEARGMEENVQKLAHEEGLAYEVEHAVQNTLDLLRVVKLADTFGAGWRVMKAMQAELFGGSPDAFAPETAVRIAAEAGVPEAEVRDVLASDRFADEVRADQAEAQALGARGVPFTVLDRRLGIPGAVPTEMYGQAIAQALGAGGA
ncbi:DsbA family oxidoreductase [Microbacterium excoecariae]|uniref:DsbA family oxidoreductase n=1 Tax=Microbacterium excoecariae TaxID=2715210 RepID=UPI001407B8F4|nr:DsbA family oxidoreductase [Microbacterium excoecariae]NHI16991.1 DsbA family oxidoreductase [Microbacterium excoecariae]